MSFVIITSSSKKFNEINSHLNGKCKQLNIDLQEIQSLSLEEVVLNKKNYFLKNNDMSDNEIYLIEDTGLYCSDMSGLFGPLIKWVYNSIGNLGLYKIFDSMSISKILTIKCSMIIFNKSGTILKIVTEGTDYKLTNYDKCGNCNKFGFDCILSDIETGKQLCQLTTEEKNKDSPRIKCLKLTEF